MRLFGLDVSIRKAARPAMRSVDDGRGWVTLHDTFPGSWQQDVHVDTDRAGANYAVFACRTLIAGDIGKLGVKLTQWNPKARIYEEVTSPAVSPFFAKPNHFQTWQKFIESWILSKVGHGNAYILKERDARSVVVAGYVLDPSLVTPMIAANGDIFYRLRADDLAQIPDGEVVVPASEIIHDRMWCLFHPLMGVSPMYACGLAATQGLEIQTNQTRFFRNSSVPGGVLVTPQRLEDDLAEKYRDRWETRYSGQNRGRVAVLGNGLDYKRVTDNAVDAEVIKQLDMTARMVCNTHHVPPYKVGIGELPTFQNAAVLNQIYYDVCLQPLVQAVEACLDEGLDLPAKSFKAQLDEDDLLRMDKAALMEFAAKGVERGIFAPDEARRKFNYAPVPGGASPMTQQQNFSLAALAKRDAKDDPFASAKPAEPPKTQAANDPNAEGAVAGKALDAVVAKFIREAAHV